MSKDERGCVTGLDLLQSAIYIERTPTKKDPLSLSYPPSLLHFHVPDFHLRARYSLFKPFTQIRISDSASDSSEELKLSH